MKTVPTFGSPLQDIELWRCADFTIKQHPLGGDALTHANERMLDLADVNDQPGAKTWAAIALRIIYLKGGNLPGVTN